MKRALREAYDRELALLKERAAEFAAEHPGLADRLGGLLEENLDPTVAGLLEGSAFLAARVQVKMQDEFHTFTRELLDQLFPESLLPTPSVLLAQARLPEGNDALDAGLRFKPGDAIDAEFVDADSRVACRFTLASPLELWPLKISDARYLSRPGQVGALGQEIADGTKAGLVIDFERVITDDKTAAHKGIADIALDRLSLHLGGTLSEGTALYEQLLFRRLRVSLSWLDRQGDRVFRRLPPDCVTGIGFGRDERLFNRRRQFSGFSFLREFFIFPRKFLGFHIDGLRSHLSGINSASFQIVFEFDSLDEQLSERFEPEDVILHAVPAINLFNEVSSNVKLDRKQHEYIVTPNSSPITNFEFHDLTEVWAFYSGEKSKVPVWPLYALPKIGQDPRKALFYSVRRKPRRLTLHERRRGLSRNRYRGTETFITLYEPLGEARVQRLQVRGLCSNRHLAEHLPVNQGSGDFTMSTDQSVMLNCIAGPTPPRDSLADMEVLARHRTETGHTLWRLISYLSLSRFGFDGPDPVANAAALREVLWLFADLSQLSIEAQINALTKVTTRPVTRTIAMADGYHAARGLEVTLLFDEAGTESSGIALLGAVIERFLAEYTTINSFTQTILTSVQRGQITRFPPRAGHGPLL